MWSIIYGSRGLKSDYVESAIDLLTSSSRKLILGAGGVYLAWLVVVAGSLAGQISLEIMPTTLVIALSFGLAYWLLPSHLTAAHCLWLLGSALGITLALLIFRRPEIAFLYSLIPLMAAVTIGLPAAMICAVCVQGLVIGFATSLAGNLLPAYYINLSFFVSFLTGILGWTATSSLFATIQWSLYSYDVARSEVEDARAQRLELQQVQEDLLQANKELSRLTDRLKTMTRVAEAARRVKEEFVANVSHELRTPLNMIIGYTDLMLRSRNTYGSQLPPRLLADIDAIQRNSHQLVELINDVLDLSQVDAGRMALTKQWTTIQEIVAAAVTAVQPLFDSKGLYLEQDVPAEALSVFCDSTRLREVVLNLFSNAGRFTEHGGVLVQARQKGDDLVVSVTDTGPGISLQDQHKLFEPFQQLDSALHHTTGGSGLGLSICKRFVEMHGGKMWLESEVGVGTTFYFNVPIDPALSDPALAGGGLRWLNRYEEYQPRTHKPRAFVQEPRARFVVVESEESLQKIFSRYLQGVDITPVKTMEEGMRALEHSPAQALIVNELAACRAEGDGLPVARLPFDTPVIGCWAPGKGEATRRLGVVDYLLKPVRQDELLAALDGIAGGADRQLNVLIVDDNQEALQLFARIISANRGNYRVIRADSGRAALALMRERQPDAVLLDLALPDIDGFQVLKEKAGDASISRIPVVVVSSTDYSGAPSVSDTLILSRNGGFSVREFLACVRSFTEILAPGSPQFDPAQPENSPV